MDLYAFFAGKGANESAKIGLKSFSNDGYVRGFRIPYAFCIFQFRVCSGTPPTNDAHWLNVLPGPTIKSQIGKRMEIRKHRSWAIAHM